MKISSSFIVLTATIFFLGIIAPPCLGSGGYTLRSGETLNAYDTLQNDPYVLVMQKDCNLVLFHGDSQGFKPVWSSNTNLYGEDCYARLENNGDFVLYSQKNEPVSVVVSTAGEVGDYVLILHADEGEVSVYGPHRWSTTLAPNSAAAAQRAAGIKLATTRKLANY